MKIIKTLIIFLSITISHKSLSQCWTQIAAGGNHTVAIKSDGTLWTWGSNDKGQLGDGTTINKIIPTQIGFDNDWSKIDANSSRTIALKADGSLWCWGNNNSGQVGDGNFGNGVINTTPTQVGTNNDWSKFTIDGGRTFAIKNNGTLWGWGSNENSRLGTGDTTNHYVPFQIGTDNNWIDVSAGGNNTLALKSNNTLWGWGLNKLGSLGIGLPSETEFISIPTEIDNDSQDWQIIETAYCCNSTLIKNNGTLWGMGSNGDGNIGNGSSSNVSNPVQVGIDNDWSYVTTSNHTCAIKTDGTLWSWGLNFAGQIGDGTLLNRNTPTLLAGTWKSVKTGAFHTVALSSDNTLYAWGYNNNGQLGDGTLIDKAVITQIGNSCPLNTSSFETLQFIDAIPNPTSNETAIRFVASENTDLTITITNTLGQTIYRKNMKSNLGENQESIDLTTFSAGVYCITLSTYKQQSTIKIIKN